MLVAFRKKGCGFTLVELLVVISIIALLLSILMPSLQKARMAAREVVCGSNLHQLGLAVMAYESSNGRMPQHYAENPTGSGDPRPYSWPEQLAGIGEGADMRPMWQLYLPNLNFLTCPLIKTLDINISTIPLKTRRIYCGYSFVYGYFRDRSINNTWGSESTRWVKSSQTWRYRGKKVDVVACDRLYKEEGSLKFYRVNHGQRIGLPLSYVSYEDDQLYVNSVYQEVDNDSSFPPKDLREKTNASYLFKDGSVKKYKGSDSSMMKLYDPRNQTSDSRYGSQLVPVQ